MGFDSPFFLLPHHQKMIDESMITPEVAAARGYRSILNSAELAAMGFSEEQQQLVPCLYVPLWNLAGELAGHSIRPDKPRLNKQGKEVKYERPPGSTNFIDCNPSMPREWLTNLNIPLIFSEGARKVDSGVSDNIPVLGLNGTWGWVHRDSVLNGSRMVIPDFRNIPLMGRETHIAFDNDAMSKEEVYQALVELGEYLKTLGAVVKYIHIELEGHNDKKLGLDDFRFYGGDILQLVKKAEAAPREPAGLRKYQNKENFWAYPPTNKFIYLPTGDFWVPEGVNASLEKVQVPGGKMKPTDWLTQRRSVQQVTWVPGEEQIIQGKLIVGGAWIDQPDSRAFNTYIPPDIREGDPELAQRWIDHIEKLYPLDVEHILNWFAQRVQNPAEKINHALVLGGAQGIGKDTIIDPVAYAIGHSNFKEATPSELTGRFNKFFKSVILRVSEMRDLGETSKYGFYEMMKIYTASPPEFITVDEKFQPAYQIPNIVGIIYTTNNERDGLYLVPEDRRHYVAWSDAKQGEFTKDYFSGLHRWYYMGGVNHVAAFLRARDISRWDAKAPPPKTEAFWQIVDSHRSPEEGEVRDLLDVLGWPDAIIIPDLVATANKDRTGYEEATGHNLAEFLTNPKTRKQVPHKLAAANYVMIRNPDAEDGRWKIGKGRFPVYAKREFTYHERLAAARLRQEREGK